MRVPSQHTDHLPVECTGRLRRKDVIMASVCFIIFYLSSKVWVKSWKKRTIMYQEHHVS